MNIDIKGSYSKPRPLNMGARGIEVNSRYFTVNGKAVLPVMGEFHFSRYPHGDWAKEIAKMRAGGVNIIATYIFWIHHEERRDEWDFSGDRDLRAFIEICRAQSMPLVLRIGPFAHGECRNGGLPDWIVSDKDMNPRTNDARYLERVKKLFDKIGEQARGLMFKDGGPVIGVQLENEYGHVGGPKDLAQGVAHMRKLKELAQSAGLVSPFYSATGWGGAYIIEGETLPVQGGYVDAPWNQDTLKAPPTRLHLFEPFLDDGGTGADWARDERAQKFNFDPDAYPFLTAELGGGLQVTHHRRTYPSAADVEALTLCRMGSGANLIGYYMYHGGVNPRGKYSTLQESRASGFTNDLPIKSYDFFAPLRESGEASKSYGALKKHLLFLNEFGGRLAPMACVLPDERPRSAADTETPRVCVRHDFDPEGKNAGFVFINNHQRGESMGAKPGLNITLKLPGEEIALPGLDVKPDECMLLPYNFDMGGATLRATNAQPLCKLGDRWIFWCDGEPIYDFAKGYAYIDTLTRAEADKAYKLGDSLFVSDALMYELGGEIFAETTENTFAATRYRAVGDPERIEMRRRKVECGCEFKQIGALTKGSHATKYDGDYIEYELKLAVNAAGLEDALLEMQFDGDRVELYCAGELAADWFNSGFEWRTALKRLNYPDRLTLRLYAPTEDLYSDMPINAEPKLRAARVAPLYRFDV